MDDDIETDGVVRASLSADAGVGWLDGLEGMRGKLITDGTWIC